MNRRLYRLFKASFIIIQLPMLKRKLFSKFPMTWLSNKTTVILSVLTSFAIITESFIEPTYLHHACPNVTTLSPKTVYRPNLDILLSKLSSEASRGHEFYKKITGHANATVYGSYLCGGHVNATVCKDWRVVWGKRRNKKCPVEADMVLWYDECVLRFSDRSFFDTVSYRPGVILLMDEEVKVNAKEDFRKRLEKLMDESSREVENSAKRFLTKEIEFTDLETIYSVMQCTPDLSGGDCTACLAEAIERLSICYAEKLGGRVLFVMVRKFFLLIRLHAQWRARIYSQGTNLI